VFFASARLLVLVVVMLFAGITPQGIAEEGSRDLEIRRPELFIKILDWNFYVGWGGVAIIHHVTIENTSQTEYRDIRIVVRYYSTSPGSYGVHVGNEIGVLKISLPPKSRATYLGNGFPIGAGSSGMEAGAIEVLGAEPVK
jgi:hypothetical protein